MAKGGTTAALLDRVIPSRVWPDAGRGRDGFPDEVEWSPMADGDVADGDVIETEPPDPGVGADGPGIGQLGEELQEQADALEASDDAALDEERLDPR